MAIVSALSRVSRGLRYSKGGFRSEKKVSLNFLVPAMKINDVAVYKKFIFH